MSISPDCPAVIRFAFGANLHVVHPTKMDSLVSNCCTSALVTCESNRVTIINFSSLRLNGTINGTSIPTQVYLLQLGANKLNGTIPRLANNLANIDFRYNKLSGPLPFPLPSASSRYFVTGNQLSGDLKPFPTNLEFLQIAGNRFTGKLQVSKPKQLLAYNNLITDVFVGDSSLLTIVDCNLDNNPMYGNTNLTALSMCSQRGMFSLSNFLTSGFLVPTFVFEDIPEIVDDFSYSTLSIDTFDSTLSLDLTTSNSPSSTMSSTIDIEPNIAPTSLAGVKIDDPIIKVDILIVIAISGFVLIVLILFFASRYLKSPKMITKFTRKNSFGSLMTTNTAPNIAHLKEKSNSKLLGSNGILQNSEKGLK